MRPQSHIIDFAKQNQLGADEKQIDNSKNKTIKKVNITNLLTSLYNYDFFINFLYGKLNDNSLNIIFKLFIKFIYYTKGNSNKRICKRSNFISYFKPYSINNKSLCK